MNTRTLLAIGLVVGALAFTGCTTRVVTADGPTQLHTVSAGGVGIVAAAPDTAEMAFGATAASDDSRAALEQASKLSTAITAAVKKAGVAEKDIQTANVSVYPYYSYEGEKPVVTGYRATVSVRTKIHDMAVIGDVISAASDAGANEISGPSFTLTDDAEARSSAIERAVADARVSAEAMAKAAGRAVGDVIAIQDSSVSIPSITLGARMDLSAADSVPIETGELEISANVTVVFELK